MVKLQESGGRYFITVRKDMVLKKGWVKGVKYSGLNSGSVYVCGECGEVYDVVEEEVEGVET